MCRPGETEKGAQEDEAWDINSDGSASESESEAEGPTANSLASKPNQGAAGGVVPPLKMAPPPARTYVAAPPSARTTIPAVPARAAAQAASSSIAAGSLMTLVSHLRSDNFRLRQALVNAQREVEEAAEKALEQGSTPAPAVDFAHLLSLAKELGDGLGGIDAADDWWGESDEPPAPEPPATARLYTIGSPRGESKDVSDELPPAKPKEDDVVRQKVARLEGELRASRSEVDMLKAELALKEAQLASLQN